MRIAALLLIMLAGLVGCREAVACTEIGSASGVNVLVEAPAAPNVTALELRICWSGQCHMRAVELSPGSDTVDQGCNGTDPDSVCSATAVPNGMKVAFVDVADLPVGELSISATVTGGSKQRQLDAITVQSAATYPNGPQCGAGGNQANLTVSASGLR